MGRRALKLVWDRMFPYMEVLYNYGGFTVQWTKMTGPSMSSLLLRGPVYCSGRDATFKVGGDNTIKVLFSIIISVYKFSLAIKK